MELTRQLLAHPAVLFALQATIALELLLTLLTIHAPWGTTVQMVLNMLQNFLAPWAHLILTKERQMLVDVSNAYLVVIALVKDWIM